MTATSHAVIGTIIAAKIGNPYLAIPIAIASHIAADLVPHWDVGTNRHKKTKQKIRIDAAIDVIAGFIVSYLLITFLFPQTNLLYAFIIILAAQSPDWLMTPYYFFGIKQFKWAYLLGKATNRDLDKPWGIINQVGIVILLIILAKIL
ncbi:MAG: hypothetical protein HYT83_00215 [Candidatus Levybacteria bacterium]|nr:hypothetical protein [Candidatus Levybacteria bacterium]